MEKIADKIILVHYLALGMHSKQAAIEQLTAFRENMPKDDSVF